MEKQKQNNKFYHHISQFLQILKKTEEKEFSEGETEVWERINCKIQENKKTILFRRSLYISSAAACIAVIFAFSYQWYISTEKETLDQVIANMEIKQADEITLIASNGSEIRINDNSNIKYNEDGTVEVGSKILNQSDSKIENKKETYNQVIVPKGKRSNLLLSDGTKIILNSGTKIVFPCVFSESDKKREIYVDGEIYLDVKRDENRPFIVHTNTMDIKVLGTSFNVCAYKEDLKNSVVLVSGKVEVETKTKKKITLNPDEMAQLENDKLEKATVETFEYICWTESIMLLDSEPLNNVLAKLSRYYGLQIEYEQQIASMPISGKLDLRETLEDVINIIANTAPITITKEGGILNVKALNETTVSK